MRKRYRKLSIFKWMIHRILCDVGNTIDGKDQRKSSAFSFTFCRCERTLTARSTILRWVSEICLGNPTGTNRYLHNHFNLVSLSMQWVSKPIEFYVYELSENALFFFVLAFGSRDMLRFYPSKKKSSYYHFGWSIKIQQKTLIFLLYWFIIWDKTFFFLQIPESTGAFKILNLLDLPNQEIYFFVLFYFISSLSLTAVWKGNVITYYFLMTVLWVFFYRLYFTNWQFLPLNKSRKLDSTWPFRLSRREGTRHGHLTDVKSAGIIRKLPRRGGRGGRRRGPGDPGDWRGERRAGEGADSF